MPRPMIAMLSSLLLGGCLSLTEFEESPDSLPEARVVAGREATLQEAREAQRQSARRARSAVEAESDVARELSDVFPDEPALNGKPNPPTRPLTPPPTAPTAALPSPLSDQAMDAESQGRWEEARRLHASDAVSRPGVAGPLLGQARALIAAGRAADAATMLESWARSGLASPELYKATADAILASGSASLALPYYERAWRQEPEDAAIRLDYAAGLYQAGRHAEAVGVLGQVHPDQMTPPELLLLGRASLLAYQSEAAVEALGRYVRAEPADTSAWLDLSRAQLLAGDNAAAMEALRPVVQANPQSIEAAVLLGHIHVRTGKRADALHYYEVALRLGAPSADLDPMLTRLRASIPKVADR